MRKTGDLERKEIDWRAEDDGDRRDGETGELRDEGDERPVS